MEVYYFGIGNLVDRNVMNSNRIEREVFFIVKVYIYFRKFYFFYLKFRGCKFGEGVNSVLNVIILSFFLMVFEIYVVL